VRSLERSENTMVRWMCGVTLWDRSRSVELKERLSNECISDVIGYGRLGWFGSG
jgi:hypothetical protein